MDYYRIDVNDDTINLHYYGSQCAGLITFYQLDKTTIDNNLLVIDNIKNNIATINPIVFAETATAIGQLYYENGQFVVQESFSSTYLPHFLTIPVLKILNVINLVIIKANTRFIGDNSIIVNKQLYNQAFNQFKASLINGY